MYTCLYVEYIHIINVLILCVHIPYIHVHVFIGTNMRIIWDMYRIQPNGFSGLGWKSGR